MVSHLAGEILVLVFLKALYQALSYFLIFINDLTEGISSNIRLFVDDVALFAKGSDPDVAYQTLKNDLSKISLWASKWKKQFNPDPTKPATEVIFSHKQNKPPLTLRFLSTVFR